MPPVAAQGSRAAIAARILPHARSDSGGTRLCHDAIADAVGECVISGNYTLSHCIGDGVVTQPGSAGITPGMRKYSRGNCGSTSLGGDRRHVVNLSTFVETPQFANNTLRLLGSGWQVSGILKMQSGTSVTITTGFDNTLTGTNDNGRALQVLLDPYLPNRNRDGWLNPAAFARPPSGVYG